MNLLEATKISGKIDRDGDFFIYLHVNATSEKVSSNYVFLKGYADVTIGKKGAVLNIEGQLNYLNIGDQTRSTNYHNVSQRSDEKFLANLNCELFEHTGFVSIPIQLEHGWTSNEPLNCGIITVNSIFVEKDDEGDFLINYEIHSDTPFVSSISLCLKGDEIDGPVGEYFSEKNNSGVCYVPDPGEQKQGQLIIHQFSAMDMTFEKTVNGIAEVEAPYENLEEIHDDEDELVSDEIIIRFVFSKGEGEWPEFSELTNEEIEDPSLMAEFVFDWDPEEVDDFDIGGISILEAQFLYDGISYLPKSDFGLRVADGNLNGFPSPIVKFKLSNAINANAFLKAVSSSSIVLMPKNRAETDQEPFYFEDHNGYSSAIELNDVAMITNNEISLSDYRVLYIDEIEAGVELQKVKTAAI